LERVTVMFNKTVRVPNLTAIVTHRTQTEVLLIVEPVTAVASKWRSISDSDPEPRNINTINIDSGPVLPSSFDSST
jgi:hypothetical protein